MTRYIITERESDTMCITLYCVVDTEHLPYPETVAEFDFNLTAIRRANELNQKNAQDDGPDPDEAYDRLYDVLAVSLSEPHTVRVLDTGQTEWNAVGIAEMTIDRQGLETEYYQVVPSGTYRNGDTYRTPPTEDNS